MPRHTFILNGKRVRVNSPNNVRMLWVVRDLLGVTGPKYGCGIGACQACTSHLNGNAVNLCCIPVSRIKRSDRITTIEGLARSYPGRGLHPMQQAWLNLDVSQCGFCQPGQIMAAVAKVNDVMRFEGRRRITDSDIDEIRNICRCGTYPRIREAIKEGAAGMRLIDFESRRRQRRARRRRRRRELRSRRQRQRERRLRNRRRSRARGSAAEPGRGVPAEPSGGVPVEPVPAVGVDPGAGSGGPGLPVEPPNVIQVEPGALR